MSARLKFLNLTLRWTEKRILARSTDPAVARARLERQADRFFRMPKDAHVQEDRLTWRDADVPVLWASQGRPKRRSVLLYLHGGAYITGSPRTHVHLAARIAGLAGMRGVLPDYRRAPEHAFPAALDDAMTSYRALLEAGYAPERIALAGDSAGGGLALALLHQIGIDDLPMPACTIALSPWTDLTLSGASLDTNQWRDVMLPASRMPDISQRYLQGADPRDPRCSPIFGEFAGASPVLIQASRAEILSDDATRMARVLQAAGADVQLEMWRDTPHVWQLFQGRLPEADKALCSIGAFLNTHISEGA